MANFNVENNASTYITSNIAYNDSTIPVNDTSSFPSPYFRATLDDGSGNIEIVDVATVYSAGDEFQNVSRGQEGTSSQDFAADTTIENRITRDTYDNNRVNLIKPKYVDGAAADDGGWAANLAVGGFSSAGQSGVTAIGYKASSGAPRSEAIGTKATSSFQSTVIGYNTTISGSQGVVVGKDVIGANDSVMLGMNAGNYLETGGTENVAVGRDAQVYGNGRRNVSIGFDSLAGDGLTARDDNTVVGAESQADYFETVVVGSRASANGGPRGVAVGYLSSANVGSVVVGHNSDAGTSGVSIGENISVNGSTGIEQIAIGNSANPSHNHAIGIGVNAEATALESMALGPDTFANASTSNGRGNIALGEDAKAYVDNDPGSQVSNIAVGRDAKVYGYNSVGVGDGAQVHSGTSEGVAVGGASLSDNNGAVAVGYGAASGVGGGPDVAIGKNATGSSTGASIGVGLEADAVGNASIAVGGRSTASNDESIAIGYNSNAVSNGAIAIGKNASNEASGESVIVGYGAISEGSPGPGRTIFGSGAAAYGQTVAVGRNTVANNTSVAVGDSAQAGQYGTGDTDAVAIGNSASATGQASVAVGNDAKVYTGSQGGMHISSGISSPGGTTYQNSVTTGGQGRIEARNFISHVSKNAPSDSALVYQEYSVFVDSADNYLKAKWKDAGGSTHVTTLGTP